MLARCDSREAAEVGHVVLEPLKAVEARKFVGKEAGRVVGKHCPLAIDEITAVIVVAYGSYGVLSADAGELRPFFCLLFGLHDPHDVAKCFGHEPDRLQACPCRSQHQGMLKDNWEPDTETWGALSDMTY